MKQKKQSSIKLGCGILFIIYLIVLIYFLFFSERYGRNTAAEGYRYNLQPFAEIKRYIFNKNKFTPELFWLNIGGNIIAFIPFGFLLPFIFPKSRNFFVCFFEAIMFSAMIETIQLLTRVGSFDVDDIILNSLGGLLGYIIYISFFYKRSSKKDSRSKNRKGVHRG